ncbi:glycoside hydrolase family 2 protein [Nakamurella endophytica]|uniref:beta-mannosidase n=1 Tax=Nakamurella endophytica TaxID=1748367 RepID=A0A917SXY3_9ACTN|nr:glycoside hydrolase family 2 protein [Nakamurella endophytica]GGM00300.1 beta-mannosidase [Nakamurella endophytica]
MTRSRTPLVDGWTLALAGPGDGAADGHPAPPSPDTVPKTPVTVPKTLPDTLPDSVPATVPGTVHTDLLAAGLIPDPYLDRNELDLDWIGHQRWSYRCRFDAPPAAERTDLALDGLDTVATVLVNGVPVGRFANQHRSHRIALDEVLRPGPNEVEVVFDSAWEYARDLERMLGPRPNAYPTPFQFVRKMACNFGWDWGPSLVTAGIWRPVAVETWDTARIAGVRPLVTVDGAVGRVRVEVDVERSAGRDAALTAAVAVAGQRAEVAVAPGAGTVTVELAVPDVDLWWPHDLGDQPLYRLDVELHAAAAGDLGDAGPQLLGAWSRRIGFRTVELDTSPDATGSAWTVVVNGVPVFARGVNWIPDDCFPSRITRERLAARLDQAVQAHVDLVRVWGGGIYESEDFYELCDERGLLVWQDFLFACAAYPEEEPLRSEVLAEARENVQRLMPHPSLVLWNGCNENIWGYFDWGWRDELAGRSWGAGYYLDLLPAVVAEVDPTRPYYPGSPYSGSMDRHPNLDTHGPMHLWDVWNQRDYTAYREHRPRFAAEFGYQGPPTLPTLRRAVHDEPLRPDSPGMLHHQKAEDGNGKLARGAAPHLPEAATFEDWHYLMSVQQSEAVRFGVEHLRSLRGRCMGSVVWQLNDCWPVTSWAAVDGDGRRKLLWYGLRDAYADRLLTVQPRDEGLAVCAVNDGGDTWSGPLTVRRMSLDGDVLAEWSASFEVAGRAVAQVALPAAVCTPDRPSAEVLVAETGDGEQALWFFVPDRELALPDPGLDVEVAPSGDGCRVTVRAERLARHVVVLADRWDDDARCGDGAVTLLPGRTHAFEVTGARPPGAVRDGDGLRTLHGVTRR